MHEINLLQHVFIDGESTKKFMEHDEMPKENKEYEIGFNASVLIT
jgi:hypothetical protein